MAACEGPQRRRRQAPPSSTRAALAWRQCTQPRLPTTATFALLIAVLSSQLLPGAHAWSCDFVTSSAPPNVVYAVPLTTTPGSKAALGAPSASDNPATCGAPLHPCGGLQAALQRLKDANASETADVPTICMYPEGTYAENATLVLDLPSVVIESVAVPAGAPGGPGYPQMPYGPKGTIFLCSGMVAAEEIFHSQRRTQPALELWDGGLSKLKVDSRSLAVRGIAFQNCAFGVLSSRNAVSLYSRSDDTTLSSVSVSFDACTFVSGGANDTLSDRTLWSMWGGAINMAYHSITRASLSVTSSAFVGNHMPFGVGSAIQVASIEGNITKLQLTVSDSYFGDNVIEYGMGGAIAVFGDTVNQARLNISRCVFEHNKAPAPLISQPPGGGAVLLDGITDLEDCEFKMSDVVFDSNLAWGWGGAVLTRGRSRMQAVQAVWERCSFNGNKATSDPALEGWFDAPFGGGGAAVVHSPEASASKTPTSDILSLSRDDGARGEADGGAASADSGDDDDDSLASGYDNSFTCKNCTFDGNEARGSGGAFMVYAVAKATPRCKVPGKFPTAYQRMTVSVLGGFVENNRLWSSHDSGGQLVYSANGGGVDIEFGPDLARTDIACVGPHECGGFRSWTALSRATFTGVSFRNNTALCHACSGGGVHVSNGAHELFECNITENSASNFGGGVHVQGTASFYMQGGSAEKNFAYAQGTFLHSDSAGTVSLSDTKLSLDVSPAMGIVLFGSNSIEIGDDAQGWNQGASQQFSQWTCPTGAFFVAASDSVTPKQPLVRTTEVPPTSYSWSNCKSWTIARLELGCAKCDPATYSLGVTRMIDNPSPQTFCHQCPPGANCSAGGADVRPMPGYWGTPLTEDQSQLKFLACPDGYCCDAPDTCRRYDSCLDTRMGPLCGECLTDYSETFGSTRCRPNGKCNDGWWFYIVSLTAAALFTLYIVFGDRRLTGDGKVLLYFYQLAPFALTATAEGASWWQSGLGFVTGALNLQLSGAQHASACVAKGLNAYDKLIVQTVAPPLLVTLMLLLAALLFRCTKGRRRSEYGRWNARAGGSRKGATFDEMSDKLTWVQNADDGVPDTTDGLSFPGRLLVAGVKLGLFVYSSVSHAVFSMLHCVTIPGWADARVFRAADQRCHGGALTIALWVVAAVLVLMPVLLVVLKHRVRSRGVGSRTTAGVLAQLEGSFVPRANAWEALMMTHRLALVASFTFSSTVPLRSLLVNLVSLLALALHVAVQPFRKQAVNHLQTGLLTSLLVIGALNLHAAGTTSTAGSDEASHSITTMDGLSSVLQAGYIALPGLIAVVVLMFRALRGIGELLPHGGCCGGCDCGGVKRVVGRLCCCFTRYVEAYNERQARRWDRRSESEMEIVAGPGFEYSPMKEGKGAGLGLRADS